MFEPWLAPAQTWECYGPSGKARTTQPNFTDGSLRVSLWWWEIPAACSLGEGVGVGGGGGTHSVWLRDLTKIVVSRGHSRWCPAYVESEQALLNTTKVTRQQCSVSFGWQPTNDLTSPPADPGGGAAAWTESWMGVGRPGQAWLNRR